MSTESERVELVSEASASRFEVGNDQMSETLAGQAQELKTNGGDKEGCGNLASAGDNGMEKVNGFTDLEKETESVNGGLDLGTGTENVGGESNGSENKVLVDSEEVLMVEGEKDSDGIERELLIEKEMEPDMVCSHGADLSDVKVSDSEDLGEDRKLDGLEKRGTQVEDLDVVCFMGLEEHESKDESISDDDVFPVTAKVKISDSDLVWAKVRSHPWWPGQVFDASAATDKANKYFKKGSFLVTYFGDCTFAWNDASRIKPFRQHFSQMAKQSSLPDFIDAIDFALEEVSRRIEFGLACSCISEEVYQKIKTQNIINPGIREDSSSIHGGDKVSSAVFFEPANLVGYVKRLACSPIYDATDALQLVSQRAQLLAFNRWKGYTDLPEFVTLQGSVESAPKISPAEEKSSVVEVSDPEPKKSKQVYTKRRKTEVQDGCKHDGVFEYEETTVPKKKEKTLAEFIAEKRLRRHNGNTSHENSGNVPLCEKKRKVVQSKVSKSTKKIKADLQTEDPGSPVSQKNDQKNNLSAGDKITPEKARKSFGIGASILKVANQMHCSTPTRLIPCNDSTSKKAAKSNGSGKSLQEKPKAEALSAREISPSTNETLSNPHAASVTKTSSGKSNSISVDHNLSGELEQVMKEAPSTNLVEDPMLESRDLKDSAKEQMVHEDKKEAANIADEKTIKDSNLIGEKISGKDLKQQPNKNCPDGSDSSKEDVSAE
ncbi:PWWP domain [Arabidopsis suecica]|uniref:PWWP domain n=1 Tax=Arabidopsis suecica TaxID=45249 RepID=A0A8T2B5B7_ARASU|nr:PWWP domain [Arabidopsis suecica]